MSGTLGQFAARLNQLSIQISGNIDQAVRTVALAVDQAVVLATPVDTGRARSNWLVSVSTPRTDTIGPYNPGKSGNTGAANVTDALEQAKRVVASYQAGQTIYISNNLPYIQRLNAGWSNQAPSGYVLRAVEAAATAIGNVRIVP